MSFITIVVAVTLVLLGVPLLFAIAVGCIVAIGIAGDVSLLIVIQQMFQTANMNPIVAVPLFMLAGEVMNSGGLSQRIIAFGKRVTGHIVGSSALSSTLGSMLFAAMSGSAVATAAAIGTITIPMMIRDRFQRAFATTVQAFSASLGVVIPPSITLIIYGALAGVSVSKLFMASIIPGILAGVALMLVSYRHARREQLPTEPFAGWRPMWKAFRSAVWAILMPIIILGGIFSGVFTPTEAAGVAVLYGLIVALFIHRDLRLQDLYPLLTRSAMISSIPILLFCVAGLLTYIFNVEWLPERLAEATTAATSSKVIFLLIINVLLFAMGMLMETSALLIVLTPVLAPLAASFGIDPIHFGVMMNLNLAIGQATPPVGSCLFVSCAISKTDIGETFRPAIPFLVASWVVLLLVTYIPQLSLCLLGSD